MKPIAFYILDLVTNLVNEKVSGISIMIRESKIQDLLMMTVAGYPVGKEVRKAIDVPILRYKSSASGGSFQSEVVGNRQVVTATFRLSNPERCQLGDIAGIITIMIAACLDVEFDYIHTTDKGTFCFSTEEARKSYKVRCLKEYETLNMIGLSISEGLKGIGIADINA
jgi:hypothetical protein